MYITLFVGKNSFYWDFMGTYVGVGMMCPYSTSISLLIGSIISWAFMFPYIQEKKGDWYAAKTQAYSIHGLGAYKVMSCSTLTTFVLT